jgi:hypothetical protein
VGDFTTQVHDWEPGIASSGLFWTEGINPSAIDVDPRHGRARLRARSIPVPDFHDFGNAVSPDPTSVPSHVSFDVRWNGGGERTAIRDETYGFRGEFVSGDVTIDFAAKHDGTHVVYRSDPNGQETISGGVGRERNGVFFDRGDH